MRVRIAPVPAQGRRGARDSPPPPAGGRVVSMAIGDCALRARGGAPRRAAEDAALGAAVGGRAARTFAVSALAAGHDAPLPR